MLVTGGKTFVDINEDVSRPLENFPTKKWWVVFGTTIFILSLWAFVVTQFVGRGQGVLGLNQPSGWGTDITNFVFWVGIGHAGTLISAILFLFRHFFRCFTGL
jgi:molybdopterin-containing oxidoreductase family membrane subunit